MQDNEMISRIRQGEKSLLAPLTEKYYDEIFRFCYYRTGNEQTAYDCTQETFLHLLKFMESYIEAKKFKSYLLRIALNVCRDYYRQNDQSLLSFDMLTEEGGEPGQLPGISSDGGRESTRTVNAILVQGMLMKLPDFQREAIILHFYYGYKAKEIAHITGVTLPAAKSRLQQGMDKLREHCKKEGIYG